MQGVFFRAFTQGIAHKSGVTGYVRNRPDGSVEVYGEGSRERLEEFLDYLKEGPPKARIDSVDAEWAEVPANYSEFTIEY